MGRVDEAMRRAAEGKTTTVPRHREFEPSVPVEPTAHVDAARPARNDDDVPRLRPVEPPPSSPAGGDRSATRSSLIAVRERIDGQLSRKVVVDPGMAPASREQYRRLATTLHQAQISSGVKVVMLTSAVPGEGKTLTASNLALTLSESYRKQVLLIDADLRRPSLHVIFHIDGQKGLCDGLVAQQDQKLSLHQVSNYLTVLPAGTATSDPMGALTSDRMRRLIEEAREAFDWVIVDTPPVGLLSDANLLASMVDGALFVIKANETPHLLVQRALDAVGRDRILGVVLNRATTATTSASYGYARYYTHSPEGTASLS